MLLDDSFNFLGRAHLARSPFPPFALHFSISVPHSDRVGRLRFFFRLSSGNWRDWNGTAKKQARQEEQRARADFYELSTLSFSSVPVFLNPRSG